VGLTVTAAVAREGSAELTVESLQLEPPRADEVLVRFTAAGLCATDLDAAAGQLATPRPVVLGHEGVGVVEVVGAAVAGMVVRPGDRVVCSLDSCGACPNCRRGQPAYCRRHSALNFEAHRADGSVGLRDGAGVAVHDHFFGQSSFAGYGLAHPASLVVVDGELPSEVLAPLGCGVVTGAGAVWNTLRVQPGAVVAVFGAGTVGLSAVMAARVAGAARVIAVDLHPNRLDLARALGATDAVAASTSAATAAAVLELTGGHGSTTASSRPGPPR
jgi:aryl-alcohol dehydrogenase